MILFFVLVPIIPEFLYDMRHPNATLSEHLEGAEHHLPKTTTTTMSPTTVGCTCGNGSNNAGPLEFILSTTTTSIG